MRRNAPQCAAMRHMPGPRVFLALGGGKFRPSAMDSVRVHITCKPLGVQQGSVRDCREAVTHATLSDFVGKGGSAAVFKYSHWFAKAFDWGDSRSHRVFSYLQESYCRLWPLMQFVALVFRNSPSVERCCSLSLDSRARYFERVEEDITRTEVFRLGGFKMKTLSPLKPLL